MARLPHNIERVRDGSGYRYRGYAADGFCVRLCNSSGQWQGRAVLTGAHVGCAPTLEAMSAKLATFTVQAKGA